MIKAETMHDSVVVDPYGRIVERVVTPRGARATLVADVPLGSGDSPYVRVGPLFGWLTLIAAVALQAAVAWSKRNRSRDRGHRPAVDT